MKITPLNNKIKLINKTNNPGLRTSHLILEISKKTTRKWPQIRTQSDNLRKNTPRSKVTINEHIQKWQFIYIYRNHHFLNYL